MIRHASRWADDHPNKAAYLRLLTTLLLSLRGSVCIYQGEELGLPEADVSFEDLQDPYGIQFWPKFKGRDGCRTPMPWQNDAPNAGFSDVKTWLPVADTHVPLSVNLQVSDPTSLHAYYKDLLAMRKQHPVLAKGALTDLGGDQQVLTFIRSDDSERLLCVFNLSDQTVDVDTKEAGNLIDEHQLFNSTLSGQTLTVAAWSVGFVRLHNSGNL